MIIGILHNNTNDHHDNTTNHAQQAVAGQSFLWRRFRISGHRRIEQRCRAKEASNPITEEISMKAMSVLHTD